MNEVKTEPNLTYFWRKKGGQKFDVSKAILVQAWIGPEGSRNLRSSDFKTIGT